MVKMKNINNVNKNANLHEDGSESKKSKSLFVRVVFIVLTWICLFLAVLGLFIPGLPSFDFILLAVICAAKGSDKLHQMLVNNRYIGPILHEWKVNRKIPKKAKYMSTLSMSIAAAVMIYTIPHPWFVYSAIFCMICVLIWIWRK